MVWRSNSRGARRTATAQVEASGPRRPCRLQGSWFRGRQGNARNRRSAHGDLSAAGPGAGDARGCAEEPSGTSYITPFPEGDVYKLQAYGDAFAEGLLNGLAEAFAGDGRVQVSRKHRAAGRPGAPRVRRRDEGRGGPGRETLPHRRGHDRLSATAIHIRTSRAGPRRSWARRMARGIRPARRPLHQDAETAGASRSTGSASRSCAAPRSTSPPR